LDLAGAEAVSFRVRASAAAREAVAVLEIEEGASLEMAVRLPPAWPLRPADVECRRKVPSLALPACMCVYNREQPHGWGEPCMSVPGACEPHHQALTATGFHFGEA
jgi:hypothetical protein